MAITFQKGDKVRIKLQNLPAYQGPDTVHEVTRVEARDLGDFANGLATIYFQPDAKVLCDGGKNTVLISSLYSQHLVLAEPEFPSPFAEARAKARARR